MITAWFLIISYYHGGIVAIPQASRDQCLANAAWIQAHQDVANPGGFSPAAYCLQGVK